MLALASLSPRSLAALRSAPKRTLSTTNSPLLRFMLTRTVRQVKDKAPLLSQLPRSQLQKGRVLLEKPNLYTPLNEEFAKMFGELQFTRHTAVGLWFAFIAFMAAGAVVIGGLTRLTESGLSMTSWHLIKDIKRPHTDEEWEAEFARYKEFPEFETVHCDIDLDKFKSIFFWEWFHRNWGRSIGGFYLLPMAYFYATKKFKGIRFPWYRSPPALMVLLGCQGLYGWYMVQSGLDKKHLENRLDSDIARVSQYRLAGHLSMALLLLSGCTINALQCLFEPQALVYKDAVFSKESLALSKSARSLRKMAPGMTIAMVALSILSGAFVAGLDAGMIYNNWPHMADEGIAHLPVDVFRHRPLWRDMLENPATVQLEHRIITHLTFISLMVVCMKGYKCRAILPRSVQYSLGAVFVSSWVQVILGISAILQQCPLWNCSAHQTGSVVLLSSCLSLFHFLKRVPK